MNKRKFNSKTSTWIECDAWARVLLFVLCMCVSFIKNAKMQFHHWNTRVIWYTIYIAVVGMFDDGAFCICSKIRWIFRREHFSNTISKYAKMHNTNKLGHSNEFFIEARHWLGTVWTFLWELLDANMRIHFARRHNQH